MQLGKENRSLHEICYDFIAIYNLIKNTPGVRKGQPITKQALLKKIWNQMDGQGLLVLIGLKVLVMLTSLQNIVISVLKGLLMLKIFDKDNQAANIKIKRTMFCGLVIFIKKFEPINIRRPWASEIMFCSEVITTKTFTPIKTRRPWPFDFTSFSAKPTVF